jgi:membrane-bound lytic murein transglycosylase D
MNRPRVALFLICSAVVSGCATRVDPVPPPVQAPTPLPVAPVTSTVGTPVPVVVDRISELIVEVEAAFSEGRSEMEHGRIESARDHFDRAIDLLLSEPGGARSQARLRAEFDSLLDRISALEVIALREGDGFTEAKSEPAALDDLLAAAMFERPTPAETTEETVVADLARTPHDVPIPINDKVLSYVELFQGRLRDFMQAGLERGLQYLPMIQQVFREEGIPHDLSYVPLVESAFKVNAQSRASARGMWQFMLGTGKEMGLQQNWFLDERADPEKATRAAAQYLKSLNNFFDDWHLALASYNAGPGRVQRAMRLSRQSDYWDLTATSKYLPRETREYVPMILAAIIIAKNPALYGFEVGAPTPRSYERVTVPGALDLRIIAEWAGVEVEQIQALNPELRRTTTPTGSHELKVPYGTAATVQTRLNAADPGLFVKFDFHTVKRGETAAGIARKYGIKTTDLLAANQLKTTRLKVNTVLTIPSRATSALPAAAKPTASAPASSSSTPLTYRVRRGDTLFSIARQFDTTVATLKQLNALSTDRINPGDRLTVRR